VSPILKNSRLGIQVSETNMFAWDWVEDVVSDISALRSMASSITSTTLHRATADRRSTVRRIRVSEIECLGLASLTSMMIYVIVWLLAWQAFVTPQLCCLKLALSSRIQESLFVAVGFRLNPIVAVTDSFLSQQNYMDMSQSFQGKIDDFCL
jgi:hypothetical protein